MWRSDDMSYLPRTSSGRASSRWNWVGTMCEVVTRCSSMRRSISSGIHLSMRTTVWPMCNDALPKRRTAVWYSGEPMMWTFSSPGWIEKRKRSPARPSAASSGVTPEQFPVDALGVAGGSRGVVHDVADGALPWQGARVGVPSGGIGGEAVDVAHREATQGRNGGLVGRRHRGFGESLVGQEDLGSAVLEDVGDLGRHQVMVDGDQVPPGLHRRQVRLDHLGAVGEDGGHHVTLVHALGAQGVHQLVGAAEQFAGSHFGHRQA